MTNSRATAIRESLRQHVPEMDASTRGRVLKVLVNNGHALDDLQSTDALYAAAAADRSTLTTAISAADSLRIDPNRAPAINRLKAVLRRVGYGELKDHEIVDAFRLDQVLAKSTQSIESRIATKMEMSRLGLLPRVC